MLSNNDLNELIATVPNLNFSSDLSFRFLTEGITNENYWFQIDDQEYVLRINNPDSDRLGLVRTDESKILKAIHTLPFVTENIYESVEKNISISKWIPGVTIKQHELESTKYLSRLSKQLKNLHAIPCDSLPKIDLCHRLNLYRKMIQKRHSNLSELENQLKRKAINFINNNLHSLPLCLCHNDLLVTNMVLSDVDEHIYFLDWEYAAVNHPLFELAVICKGNKLSSNAQHALFQAYFGDKAEQIFKEFSGWCWFYEYLCILWELTMLSEHAELPDNINHQLHNLIDSLPL